MKIFKKAFKKCLINKMKNYYSKTKIIYIHSQK